MVSQPTDHMFDRMDLAGRTSSRPAGGSPLDILRIFSSVTHLRSLNVHSVGILPSSFQASQLLIFAASLNGTTSPAATPAANAKSASSFI